MLFRSLAAAIAKSVVKLLFFKNPHNGNLNPQNTRLAPEPPAQGLAKTLWKLASDCHICNFLLQINHLAPD